MLQKEEPGRHLKTSAESFYTIKKAENYSEIVQELISSYSAVRYNLPLKLHILHSHLVPPPPEKVGGVSDEHGERFHQDISQKEKRYS
jgi:hypothetical protein